MTDDQPKRGRPSDYSAQVGTLICDRLEEGESLRAICSDARMPSRATIFRWIADGARGPALKNLSRPKVEWGLIWSPAH